MKSILEVVACTHYSFLSFLFKSPSLTFQLPPPPEFQSPIPFFVLDIICLSSCYGKVFTFTGVIRSLCVVHLYSYFPFPSSSPSLLSLEQVFFLKEFSGCIFLFLPHLLSLIKFCFYFCHFSKYQFSKFPENILNLYLESNY